MFITGLFDMVSKCFPCFFDMVRQVRCIEFVCDYK